MQFESSEEATQNIDGLDNIIEFMIENNLFCDYRSHSEYQKTSREYVNMNE